MIVADTVLYSFPQLVDDNGAPRRAQPTLVTVPAICLRVDATTADIFVFAEKWQAPRIVRKVLISAAVQPAPNRNQCDDRIKAISDGTLDAIRDNVKGWVKDRV